MIMENMDNIDTFNSVNYLFGKPAYIGHYYFALDDISNLSIIDKDSLRGLLLKLGCKDFMRINYLLDRNLPLFFDVKKNKLKEFEETSEISKEEVDAIIRQDLTENLIKQNNISAYEKFFGKDSDFYKQTFTKDLFKNVELFNKRKI